MVVFTHFKAKRLRRGVTQWTLAQQVGVTQGWLSQIEIGRVEPSVALQQRLADALGCDVGEVFPVIVDTPAAVEAHC